MLCVIVVVVVLVAFVGDDAAAHNVIAVGLASVLACSVGFAVAAVVLSSLLLMMKLLLLLSLLLHVVAAVAARTSRLHVLMQSLQVSRQVLCHPHRHGPLV